MPISLSVLLIFFLLFGFYGPSRFFHSFWAEVGWKQEIPEKKHLTTHKQNIWPDLGSNPQRWDDEWFRALKICDLNHLATGAGLCCWQSQSIFIHAKVTVDKLINSHIGLIKNYNSTIYCGCLESVDSEPICIVWAWSTAQVGKMVLSLCMDFFIFLSFQGTIKKTKLG